MDGMVTSAAKCSASDTICRVLSERIQSGEYAMGAKLPTEQNLCASMKVGRSTVREAMRSLQAQGFVNIRRGSGAYVVSQTGNRSEFVSKWLGENKESMTDYMTVRIDIECLAARLFVRNFSQARMDELYALQDDFEAALRSKDVHRIAQCDERLHSRISTFASNRFLQVIDRQLAEAFRDYRNVAFEQTDFFEGAIIEHRAILDALALRDTDTAVFCIRRHLQGSLRNTFGVFETATPSD